MLGRPNGGAGGVATGVDVSDPTLVYARRHWPECAFVCDDAATLTAVPNSPRDVVVSCLLLHHLHPDARRSEVGQKARVVRPCRRILSALLDPNDLVIAGRGRTRGWLRYVVVKHAGDAQAPAPTGNTQ